MGILMMVARIGNFLGPILLAKAMDRFGILPVFFMMSGLLVVAVANVLPIEETGKRKTEREQGLMTAEAMAS